MWQGGFWRTVSDDTVEGPEEVAIVMQVSVQWLWYLCSAWGIQFLVTLCLCLSTTCSWQLCLVLQFIYCFRERCEYLNMLSINVFLPSPVKVQFCCLKPRNSTDSCSYEDQLSQKVMETYKEKMMLKIKKKKWIPNVSEEIRNAKIRTIINNAIW